MEFEGLNLTHHCYSNYSIRLLIRYNFTYSIASMVTMLLTTGIFVAMIFYKVYRTTLQRLFIYLTLSIIFHLAFASLNFQLQPKIFPHTGETLCMWTGYLQTSSYTCGLLLSFEISVYLLHIVSYQVRGKPLPMMKRSQVIS